MADHVGDDRKALLAAAAERAPGAAGVGDMGSYLHAYYRHVATDDLAAAGPERLAAVATAQAAFAAHRPQGRALVRVRRGGDAALAGARDAIDIVTDDMPFLVDSVRMELGQARGGGAPDRAPAAAGPPGRHRRAARGARAGRRGQPSHDEIAESWTHLEIARCPTRCRPPCSRTCSGCSATSGSRSRTGPGCRPRPCTWPSSCRSPGPGAPGRARRPERTRRPGTALPRRPSPRPRWRRCCAGWPTVTSRSSATASTTSRTSRTGWTLRAVAGTGLGILRHDRPGSSAFATLPPEVRARARDPHLLILTKANSRSTVHRPSYLDYVAVKRMDAAGEVVGEYRFLGLYTHDAYTESITRIPVLRRKLVEVLARLRHRRGQPRRQGPRRVPGELPARGAVPDPGGAADPGGRGRAAAARAHPDPPVPAQGRLRPVHVLPGLPAPGPVHHPGQAAHPGDPARGAARRRGATTA